MLLFVLISSKDQSHNFPLSTFIHWFQCQYFDFKTSLITVKDLSTDWLKTKGNRLQLSMLHFKHQHDLLYVSSLLFPLFPFYCCIMYSTWFYLSPEIILLWFIYTLSILWWECMLQLSDVSHDKAIRCIKLSFQRGSSHKIRY